MVKIKTLLNLGVYLLGFSGTLTAQSFPRYIIADQFGYAPDSRKIAVIKDPQTGFDADESFTPGQTYVVINAINGEQVHSGSPVPWNQGNTDASSGDKVWHFDFSGITETGTYFILDVDKNQRSFDFEISPVVYNEVLKQAVRTFYYQRAGISKDAGFAGTAWSDGASHIGALQDKNCRLFSDKDNPDTGLDLSGGWYDAGDYNKYTNWTANYVVEMIKAYIEKPDAWGDDYNLPESGNGIPDLLDEIKWGLDFLLRMQREDGSVLCIVGESHASPPSAATGQSLYGPATTSASLNTAAAFAISSKVYRNLNMTAYADTLLTRAQRAWEWAELNPAVIFNNNSAENNSLGVGAGNQEEDEYGRSMSKLEAACFLFDATNNLNYRDFFDSNFQNAHLIAWTFAYPYEPVTQDLLLYYTRIANASSAVSGQIRIAYRNAMLNNEDNFPAYYGHKDPYEAHMAAYTWGSNSQKGVTGSMYFNMILYGLDPARDQDARNASMGYLHYLHGVNPLNMVYLSNMYSFGGENCVNEFYHSWFCNGSLKWDRVGTSLYGPPPGYLTGGPNPSYNWAECCPGGCGSAANNAACLSENISPPKNQPKQKSYKDFNTSWPLNSWEITENSCGYQVNYIRLLSKFVNIQADCNGDTAGTAYMDTCGLCSGGNTGRIPTDELCDCPDFKRKAFLNPSACYSYISPSGKHIWIVSGLYSDTIPSGSGCDSILIVALTVPEIDIQVTQEGEILTAHALNASYRWLNCNENYTFVENAVGQNFSPGSTGEYAVEVSQQGCLDTSACFPVNITGLLYNTFGEGLEIYPNPADRFITIDLPDVNEKIYIEMTDHAGQLLMSEVFYHVKKLSLPLKEQKGLYFLTIRDNTGKRAVMKIILR